MLYSNFTLKLVLAFTLTLDLGFDLNIYFYFLFEQYHNSAQFNMITLAFILALNLTLAVVLAYPDIL